MATTIGQLIEEEVRRQNWKMTDFADKICCTRANVYNIFERNKMDVAQLQLISKVLNHNFFADLAENPDLADASNPEVKKDLLNRRAVAQFFDVMPTVLRNLHIETNIVMPVMTIEEESLFRIMAFPISLFSLLLGRDYWIGLRQPILSYLKSRPMLLIRTTL